MKQNLDSGDAEESPDAKLVLVKFPLPLLTEMDSLCSYNRIDRSEFIIWAAALLLDYLDRKFLVQAVDEDWSEHISPQVDYEDDEDDEDDVFFAAEDDDLK